MIRGPLLRRVATMTNLLSSGYTKDVTKADREAVYERDGHCCQRCGVYAYGGSIHHRVNKSVGGDSRPANLVLLCGSGTTRCHGWVTQNPAKAATTGWAVPSYAIDRLPDIALIRTNGTVFKLDNDFMAGAPL